MTSSAPIHVLATTIPGTRDALATAATLAKPGESRIHVIAALPMPAKWTLDRQSGPVHALAKEIRRLPEMASGRVDVLPCVCRGITDITQLLPPHALIVIGGGSHRWWPTREQRLAHTLKALGYRVLFIHTIDPDEERA